MKLIKSFIFALAILSVISPVKAQNDVGSWWMLFGNFRFHDKWSYWAEAQYRSRDIGVDPLQMLLQTAVNYHVSPSSFFTFGYGYLPAYLADDELFKPSVEEKRFYEQFTLRHQVPYLHFEHRLRLENRWINGLYNNRLRYRLFLTVPIGKRQIEDHTWFFGIYDEILINTKDELFNSNWFYAGFGRQFSSHLNIQVGMMNQSIADIGDKWYTQLALVWTPDMRKKND